MQEGVVGVGVATNHVPFAAAGHRADVFLADQAGDNVGPEHRRRPPLLPGLLRALALVEAALLGDPELCQLVDDEFDARDLSCLLRKGDPNILAGLNVGTRPATLWGCDAHKPEG